MKKYDHVKERIPFLDSRLVHIATRVWRLFYGNLALLGPGAIGQVDRAIWICDTAAASITLRPGAPSDDNCDVESASRCFPSSFPILSASTFLRTRQTHSCRNSLAISAMDSDSIVKAWNQKAIQRLHTRSRISRLGIYLSRCWDDFECQKMSMALPATNSLPLVRQPATGLYTQGRRQDAGIALDTALRSRPIPPRWRAAPFAALSLAILVGGPKFQSNIAAPLR